MTQSDAEHGEPVGELDTGDRHVRPTTALAAAHAGGPLMLCLRQFAFPHDALMLFACTLDAIFELAPIVRELLGHGVGSARHIARLQA